jgi:hypothetical protein
LKLHTVEVNVLTTGWNKVDDVGRRNPKDEGLNWLIPEVVPIKLKVVLQNDAHERFVRIEDDGSFCVSNREYVTHL